MEPNTMMDGTMYPEGWHPAYIRQRRDFNRKLPLKGYTRLQRPPKYYLIDFGLSRRYDPGDSSPLEPPILGGDKSVPEFKKSVEPCNPFPTDIYCMGNMIRLSFMKVSAVHVVMYGVLTPTQESPSFDVMEELVLAMTNDEPRLRPTSATVMEHFISIRTRLTDQQLRSRIKSNNESWLTSVRRDLRHFFRSLKTKQYPAVPSRQ